MALRDLYTKDHFVHSLNKGSGIVFPRQYKLRPLEGAQRHLVIFDPQSYNRQHIISTDQYTIYKHYRTNENVVRPKKFFTTVPSGNVLDITAITVKIFGCLLFFFSFFF